MRISAWFGLLLAAMALGGPARADEWPTRPIRVIVPFPPGGPADVVGRIVAPKLGEALGQTLLIDDRGGADGIIGSDMVAKASPDGYTLLLTPSSYAMHPATYSNMPFDPATGMVPVSLLVAAQFVLVVTPSLPVHTVPELIDYAKKHPGELDYASAGAGGPTHLAFELFKMATGTNIVHVPYKGGGPALVAMAGGETQVMMAPILAAMPMVQAGQLRALAVSGPQRTPSAPDLPSIGETVPGFSAVTWYGMLAPVGTPPAIIQRLNHEIDTVLQDPDTVKRFGAIGGDPVGGPPDVLAKQIAEDIPKWIKVAKEANVHID
ncbi:MAG: tripartite tricarboxylate transporter substrate binding protein [Alphaproteobacteria bacterium]|nr:tripartite tricarboxylate transporter substrate binding protein [Alphaproteobacteria bacterium]